MFRAPLFLLILSLLFAAACNKNNTNTKGIDKTQGVYVVKKNQQYQLIRNGEPYFIEGAGGFTHFGKLKAFGGNSIRVWDTKDAGRILDQAHELGLTVCLGIWMTREKEGFDYDDKAAVKEQFTHIKREVLKYKDHPALLMWNVGNEMNAGATNMRMWDAVNQVAEMIHEVDPYHPTSTTVMNVPLREVDIIRKRCPAIDILSVNTYGGVTSIPKKVRQSGWDGPYIVSEYGAMGYWESPKTAWEEPYEQTSSQKASFIRNKYEDFIMGDSSLCMGSYVFLWGQKQEKTHTWFSLFSEKGEKTEAVDVLHYLWQGKWPANRAPMVLEIQLDKKNDILKTQVEANSLHTASVTLYDPEGDSLRYHWEMLTEVEVNDGAVDRIRKPDPVEGVILASDGPSVQWKAPAAPGSYRLFVQVSDGNDNIATANFPLKVEAPRQERIRFGSLLKRPATQLPVN